MKFKGEINSLFGDSFTRDLRRLIEKGAIEKETIKSLSHDMGVTTAYTANKDKDPFNGVDTMEQMLDDWYQKKLCLINRRLFKKEWLVSSEFDNVYEDIVFRAF